ncbi:MAG: hypothetical protein ACPGWR_13015 [Ardenticatenaceae bacterium]
MPLQLGYFLAGDTLTYRAGIEPELAAGDYDIALTLNYQDQTVEQTIRLSLGEAVKVPEVTEDSPPLSPAPAPAAPTIPIEWLIAAGFAVVFVLLFLIIIVWRQLKRSQLAMAHQGANTSR